MSLQSLRADVRYQDLHRELAALVLDIADPAFSSSVDLVVEITGQMAVLACEHGWNPTGHGWDLEIAKPLRKHTVFMPCERHAARYAAVSRQRRAEVMLEGGWASSPCTKCQMRPGTDFFTAEFVGEHPVYTV